MLNTSNTSNLAIDHKLEETSNLKKQFIKSGLNLQLVATPTDAPRMTISDIQEKNQVINEIFKCMLRNNITHKKRQDVLPDMPHSNIWMRI